MEDYTADMSLVRKLARERLDRATPLRVTPNIWPQLALGDVLMVVGIETNAEDGTTTYTLRGVEPSTSATPSTASTASGSSEPRKPRSPGER